MVDLKKKIKVNNNSITLNKIYQGDCIEIMNSIPKDFVSIIVTSPPYNLRNSSGNGMKNGKGGKWCNASLLRGYNEHSDDMPHKKYVEWQRECLNAMMRVLKEDGVIFYNHKWRVQKGLLQDRNDIVSGFPVRQVIIWKRSGGINFNSGYFLPTYEVIYMITKPKFKLKKGANKLTDIWTFSQERNNPHPAPFPLELPYRCISSTQEGIVLDPFLGSGTTSIAAKILNRKWIGIEKSSEYCKLADERIKKYNHYNLYL